MFRIAKPSRILSGEENFHFNAIPISPESPFNANVRKPPIKSIFFLNKIVPVRRVLLFRKAKPSRVLSGEENFHFNAIKISPDSPFNANVRKPPN